MAYQPILNPMPVQIQTVGAHANAWSNTVVGINGTSAAIDCQFVSHASAFGNSSLGLTLTVQYSQNNSNWYSSGDAVTLTAAGDFGFDFSPGARYVRLISSGAATITATIAGKA